MGGVGVGRGGYQGAWGGVSCLDVSCVYGRYRTVEEGCVFALVDGVAGLGPGRGGLGHVCGWRNCGYVGSK